MEPTVLTSTRDKGKSQTNQEEHRATLTDGQIEQSSLVLLGRNLLFRHQRTWIQGACWIDGTGRAEGKSLGEGENQIELALHYTSSPQSFRVRTARKNPVHLSVTQHRTVSFYWKTSEHFALLHHRMHHSLPTHLLLIRSPSLPTVTLDGKFAMQRGRSRQEILPNFLQNISL